MPISTKLVQTKKKHTYLKNKNSAEFNRKLLKKVSLKKTQNYIIGLFVFPINTKQLLEIQLEYKSK